MMSDIIHIFFTCLFIYLTINIVYLLILALSGRFIKRTPYTIHSRKKKFAVLIPSYKEDDVIYNTIKEAVEHNYPQNCFDVYVAADQLRNDTLEKLRQLNAYVFIVQFETGSKARSINYLLNRIKEDKYDVALILDGDNIMAPGCMEKINAAFQKGFRAAQCHRTAKNKNTHIAILDAVSEEINNHLFRKSQRALGFSASLIGSGMAFEFTKLKEVYNKPGILANPACDREVDFEMMKAGIVIEYIDNAYVLDEKVSGKTNFQNQRTRWLESQLIHLRLFFSKNEYIAHKTKDYWNKLFINLAPPRMIFLSAFCSVFVILFIGAAIKTDITGISFSAWAILFVLYIICLFISMPRSLYTRQTAFAILYLPAVMFSFLKAAMNINTRRKGFVHTPKTYTGEGDFHKDSK